MPDVLPGSGGRRRLMDHVELSRKLTGMAADVVRDCRVELALGWLWCNKSRDPLPQVPPDLFDTLMFVRDQGWREVEVAYTGRDYFEDCLRLALRNAPSVGVLKTRTNGNADRGASRNQTAVLRP